MASFYGWGSTASRLVPVDEAVYFLPLYGLITLISKEMVNVLTVRPKNVQAVCYANIFKRSITKNNLRYIIYIGDGDSTAFNTIEESKPYRDTIITKLECVAHVQKRLGTRCYK